MSTLPGETWLWGLCLCQHLETWEHLPDVAMPRVALHIPMNESFEHNIDKCKTMGTLLPSKNTHVDTLTYLWDHFGKMNQWLSRKNVWRESLLRSPRCQLRHWLSHSGLLKPAKSALKSWRSLCRKRSSLCYGPDHRLSPASPLHHQLTWLNGTRDRCRGWKSLPPYSSCWGNDGCFPQLK